MVSQNRYRFDNGCEKGIHGSQNKNREKEAPLLSIKPLLHAPMGQWQLIACKCPKVSRLTPTSSKHACIHTFTYLFIYIYIWWMNNMSFYLPCIPPLHDHKIHPHHHHAIIEKVHRDPCKAYSTSTNPIKILTSQMHWRKTQESPMFSFQTSKHETYQQHWKKWLKWAPSIQSSKPSSARHLGYF